MPTNRAEAAADGGPPSSPAITVMSVVRPSASRTHAMRKILVPQHREVRLDHLVGGRQIEPDLEQLHAVRPVLVEQREHLAVHDALPGGEPLHVTAAESGGRAQRVGVIDEPAAERT